MNSLTGITINQTFIPSNRELHVKTEDQLASPIVASGVEGGDPPARDSVTVNISIEGLTASSAAQKNRSSSSNDARKIEKIRERMKELQKQIQEQQAQLQAIQADRSLSADETDICRERPA